MCVVFAYNVPLIFTYNRTKVIIMIRNLTYHILHKEQNGTATLELNPNQIEPDEAHQNFLDELTNAYSGRAGKGFGIFDEY